MITRLAPSPTGALHLGNARTFLVNWIMARQNKWKILLRIEDLDGPRIKRGTVTELMEDLRWLGLDFDGAPIYQSSHSGEYVTAIEKLLREGFAYPCVCTRKEVETAASAPHAEDGSTVYPGTCRGRFATMAQAQAFSGRPAAIRFRVPDQTVRWTDGVAVEQSCDVGRQLGDFVIAKADAAAAYQLAVVVDDADAGVTHVVRGDDLLDSTPRQMLLYQALGMAEKIPNYFHLPLVVGPDGRRLAKRHGDTRLATYRQSGVPASRIRGLLAKWSGIDAGEHVHDIRSLIGRFDLSLLPRSPIVCDWQYHPTS